MQLGGAGWWFNLTMKQGIGVEKKWWKSVFSGGNQQETSPESVRESGGS